MRWSFTTFVAAIGLTVGCATPWSSSNSAAIESVSLSGRDVFTIERATGQEHPRGQGPTALHTIRDLALESAARQAHDRSAMATVAMAAMASVVQVRTHTRDLRPNGASDQARATAAWLGGSGVIIASEGIILTNEHVVRHARSVVVVLPNGSRRQADRVVVDTLLDLAVIRVSAMNLPALVPTRQLIERGSVVAAISAATELRGRCFRVGRVTSLAASLQDELDPTGRRVYDQLIESTTMLERGFSGGALIDGEGHLIGLNVAAGGDPDQPGHRGYAIPFDRRTREAVARLIQDLAARDGTEP